MTDKVIKCKYCNQLEYGGEFRWLSGKMLCRACYKKAYEIEYKEPYRWHDLDGARMTREEAKSCIGTIEMLQRLAYNIHGVMDVIDADNCKKIIKALEQEPTTKSVTIKQLEEMYTKFEQKLWREREDVRGDDMIEVGYAEQFLQDLLVEFGCWDDEVEE